MEGRHEEYMANKGCAHAMFAECLENALSTSLEDLPPVDPISPPTLPDDPDLPDSEFFLPPVTNLCVTPLSANSDLCGNLYNWCGIKFISPLTFPSTVLHMALLSLLDSYNALLDSGCTHISSVITLFFSIIQHSPFLLVRLTVDCWML